MKQIPLLILISLMSAVFPSCVTAPTREPQNLSILKNRVADYAASGAYDADLAMAAAPAKTWILQRSAMPGRKPAIVLDIDETVLSNLPHMTRADWGYQPAAWDAWMAKASAPAIPAVREIYQTARSRGVAVFFITGRKESDRAATARNLKACGMGDYQELIVRPNSQTKEPAASYKTARRKRIVDQGYTIIANIGDQDSDLVGSYAERTFKLPNPFYQIP